MSNPLTKEIARIPLWAWFFAIACFAIPVVSLGGAIPAALGCGAGGYCLTLARKTELTERARAIGRALVVVLSWSAFLAFAGVVHALFLSRNDDIIITSRTLDSRGNEVVKVARRSRSAKTDLSDESIRQEIYSMATKMHYDSLNEAYDRADRDTEFGRKWIAQLEEMHEKRLELTMKYYNISREQLDEIIDEGDQMEWERDSEVRNAPQSHF